MADEHNELRSVNWNEVFSFTHIFKSFRMAIHPSKLILALAAIVAICLTGWVLDGISYTLGNYAQVGEIDKHFILSTTGFDKEKEKWIDSRPERAARLYVSAVAEKNYLTKFRDSFNPLAEGDYLAKAFRTALDEENSKREPKEANYADALDSAKEKWSVVLDEAGDLLAKEVKKTTELLKQSRKDAKKEIRADDLKEDVENKQFHKLKEDYAVALQVQTRRKIQFAEGVKAIKGVAILGGLMDYEAACLRDAVSAVLDGRIFAGLSRYREIMRAKAIQSAAVAPQPRAMAPPAEQPGFLFYLLKAVHGIIWLMSEHWLVASIFLVISLAVVALLGGAIHRIAALHAAREEKISITQALRFSLGKFFSFFTAPLIPLAIILAIGGLLALGGFALGNWPYVGEILMGVLFLLAILGGLVIAFLSIGLVAGVGLMYPTIAVEGSDGFDAISRSFSYVLTKPWRAGLYGLVALIYGAITYLFVRLFALLALASTHCFVKWGVFAGGDTLHASADKLDVLWAQPQFDNLFGPFNWEAMNGSEKVGAFFIGIWVFLVAATVAAYLVSYASSSLTVIYYLLRKKVDATDLDDVYVEEAEEEEPPPAEPAEAEPEKPAEAEGEAQPPSEQ